jgi:gag-polyprotein putative aspartyl protease
VKANISQLPLWTRVALCFTLVNMAVETHAAVTLPAAARAAMLIASADNPQKPIGNLGSTVWSTIAPTPGEPQTAAVKADADIPDLKMHATMILRKNTDPTLPATHTIDLKFSFADGAPVTGFKDVGLPQMRKLDSTASETLTSQKVKISDEHILIALANGPRDVARNLDLMATRAWFDFPLLLNDNRIAKLVFQKSVDGEAMLEKAFNAWRDRASPSDPPYSLSNPSEPVQIEQPKLSPDSKSTAVPMISRGGTFRVPVTMNNRMILDFTVDSGAATVVIPIDVFGTLVRTGTISKADLMGKETFVFADGRKQAQQTFRIRSLRVGDHILYDVEASVAPVAGDLLLGQSFLRRFKSWSIDNQRGLLVLD